MPVMNSVGADFVKFIKSYPANTDLNAKEVAESNASFLKVIKRSQFVSNAFRFQLDLRLKM